MAERFFSLDEIVTDAAAVCCVGICAGTAAIAHWLMSWDFLTSFCLVVAWSLFRFVIKLDGRSSEAEALEKKPPCPTIPSP